MLKKILRYSALTFAALFVILCLLVANTPEGVVTPAIQATSTSAAVIFFVILISGAILGVRSLMGSKPKESPTS